MKEVTFSKEQAMQELQKELGENPEDFLGWNPLSCFLRCRSSPTMWCILIVYLLWNVS